MWLREIETIWFIESTSGLLRRKGLSLGINVKAKTLVWKWADFTRKAIENRELSDDV